MEERKREGRKKVGLANHGEQASDQLLHGFGSSPCSQVSAVLSSCPDVPALAWSSS